MNPFYRYSPERRDVQYRSVPEAGATKMQKRLNTLSTGRRGKTYPPSVGHPDSYLFRRKARRVANFRSFLPVRVGAFAVRQDPFSQECLYVGLEGARGATCLPYVLRF